MAAEVAQLKKMVREGEDKISTLNAEMSRLEGEVELERKFDQTLELLKESFF